MTATCDFSQLQGLPCFSHIEPDVLAPLAATASTIRLPGDTTIFAQGQGLEFLYAVLEGDVGLTGLNNHGEETVVEILTRGAVFLAAPVLMNQPPLMGAKTLCPARLLLLPAQNLRDVVAASPTLTAAMLVLVSAHFRAMVTEIKDLKLKSASQRLAAYLLALCDRREGAIRIVLPHSKGVIAARIGIRRETLSRALNALQDVGVEVHGPRIHIADLALLHSFCTG